MEHRTVAAWIDKRLGDRNERGAARAGEGRAGARGTPSGSARQGYAPTPNTWRMSEDWPEGAPGPVYEISFGAQPVARIWRDADDWRFVFHKHDEISTDFQEFFFVVRLMYDRIIASETRDRLEAALPEAARRGEILPEMMTSLSQDYRRDPSKRTERAAQAPDEPRRRTAG